MSESEQFRLTRWAIPGWTAILAFAGFVLIDVIFSPPGASTPLFASATDLVKTTSSMSPAHAALIAIAAGVPLGFCIYQGYFYLRWNSPFSRDGLLPPLVVGRNEDLDRTLRDLNFDELTRCLPWRTGWFGHPLTSTDHGWRWRYIENLFTEVAQEIDANHPGVSIFARHRALLDLMHTLGASLAGVYIGFAAYVVYKARVQASPISFNVAVVAGIPLFVLIFLLAREDFSRKRLETCMPSHSSPPNYYHPSLTLFTFPLIRGRSARLRVAHPAAIWIASSAIFLYLSFPSPYLAPPASTLQVRTGLALALVFVWFLAQRKTPVEIRAGESLLLATSTGASLLLRPLVVNCPGLDWSYYWSILAFMIANIAFLKNRQNIRDDLIALEYYTLRRHLGQSPDNPTRWARTSR